MSEEKIKEFVKRFFENLECVVKEKNNVLKIENIPQKFEKFYGKTGPYYFYFDSSETYKTKEGEFVTKGSYLLSCINKFLENKGETTLLKIKFEQKPEEIIKNKFSIKNCSIATVNQKKDYRFFERFTFLTTFQYLNKKEESIKDIFLQEGKRINPDLNKFELEEGKKRDFQTEDSKKLKEDYEIAKSILKKDVQEKIDVLKEKLLYELEEEKARIHEHFEEQLRDDDKNIEELKKQLEKAQSEKNPEKRDEKRIQRLEEQIKNLESKERRFELEKDKQASIDQEIQKHSLNIKNKLLNTTIIYYPFFRYEVWLKTSANSKKMIHIQYDFFENSFSEIKCDCCEKPLNEIILCSSGHLICRDCGERCESCGDIVCKKCSLSRCSQSGKKVCKKCSFRCPVCGKISFIGNTIKESFQGKNICRTCSARCSECGQLYSRKNIKKIKTGKEVCDKCYQKQVRKNILRELNK